MEKHLITKHVREHIHDALDLLYKMDGGPVSVRWDRFDATYCGGSVEVSSGPLHVATFATLGDLIK